MSFLEWMKAVGVNPIFFAKYHHLSIASVYAYSRGKKPSMRTALKLLEITQGRVTLEEMGFSPEHVEKIKNKIAKQEAHRNYMREYQARKKKSQ